ncbi:class B sortase [Streptococcus suis]|uniref:Sortase B putative n=1 Tax=Streptococcus suis TaxID=1307 RepID=A0A116LRG0_STRSU|nr:class B sortase [Streptococcus suis]NQG68971.1 class B sortase [Streptococcus suis]NQH00386.1 class B sortase [Streptococcus suis]NQH27856.1 class B sortase [Streptococcus suis]NQH31516.1 class B sortase [Streptococcus suis]NQH63832.1 class B sortase [Streptococcus suis]
MKFLKVSLAMLFLIGVLFLFFQALTGLEKTSIEQSPQDALKQKFHQNPDVYAWVRIDGTRVDYPVAQHPTDDSYYLSHDLDGNETYYGAIFTELINTKTFEDSVTILYGHAMVDDSMFGSLDYFADWQFFQDHTVITIDTIDHRYEYDIVAAHPYTDDHLFHNFQLGTKSGLDEYLDTLKERVDTFGGAYRQLAVDSDRDRVLILSTCDAISDNYRYVLTAKLRRVTERIDT